MLQKKCFNIMAMVVCFIFTAWALSLAAEDGFIAVKNIPGQHLKISLPEGVDPAILLERLNIAVSDKFLSGKSSPAEHSFGEELAQMLDSLFIIVCDALDIRLYSFEGAVKVTKDMAQLRNIYLELFGRPLERDTSAFYVHDLKTIYINANDFKRGILGHEIAHAVINSYFVMMPSEKIQEILSGYVEYRLRKMP